MLKTILILILVQSPAYAEMGAHETKALKQTQELLRDKKQRDEAVKQDPKAQDIDKKVDALAGSAANKEEMYDISAQLMDKITKEANGDPNKMQEIMNAAQKDPKAFYEKYFDENQKAQVRGLAGKIEKSNPGVNSGR